MVTNISQEEFARLLSRLTPEQQRQVMDFAQFLAERRGVSREVSAEPRRIQFDGWAGCLSHVEKSAVELQHETLDHWAEKELKDVDDASRGQ